MDMFEQASRLKTRFPSTRGELTVEQLWDLPLQSKAGFDLNSIAIGVNRALKEVSEESFVSTVANPARSSLDLQLEIVKYIISVKITANRLALERAERVSEIERLTAILARKQGEKLDALTEDEIQARIRTLQNPA
jgi:hypothetical protein